MSAYASLPGSFLPPFFVFGGISPTKDNDDSSYHKPSSHCDDQQHDQFATHQQQPITSTVSCPELSCEAGKILDPLPSFSSRTSPRDSTAHEPSEPTGSAAKSTLVTPTSPASEIFIAINNARVDTVQLIQSLTTRGSNIARRTAKFISRTSDAEETVTPTTSCAPSDTDAQTVQSRPSLCYEDSDSDDDDDMSFYGYDHDFTNYESDKNHVVEEHSVSSQDEDAIQFELFINFHGREYRAFRAFSTFVQLRNDLLRDRTVPSTVSIPELPSLSNENYESNSASSGFHALARSGFAMLQATAKMYCPAMELWLRHVVEEVPSSPILNRFLWEPLGTVGGHIDEMKGDSNDNDGPFAKPPQTRNKPRQNNNSSSYYRSKSYSTSLSSITELLDES